MKRSRRTTLFALVLAGVNVSSIFAADVSATVTLQWFESRWQTIEKRTPDLFMAGYGAVWVPPPGRADSGDQSVGYDVRDRFDLGHAGRPTLYGTEAGLRATVKGLHQAGASVYTDLVLNHNGFNDQSNSDFVNSGGYPGFVMSQPGSPFGDFHPPGAAGVLEGRLAGLIDIDQSTNFRFVRNPVPNPTDSLGTPLSNLPAGTTPYFGQLANVPDENNRRFYPDQQGTSRTLLNPTTGATITRYDFNNTTPLAGDPVEENATGYLMRHAQWMIQSVGVDGFRLDAVKHMPTWFLNDFYDAAVYAANPRKHLDGSERHVFSFGEHFEGNSSIIQPYVRKDINPLSPNTVGGNRDALDFPLFFAMQSNLSGNGVANDWRNIVNASFDRNDDGLANNGSQGVAFAQSHDKDGAYLNNVAHAYMLMRPGNAIVYFNAKEFGTGRPFPKDGRGDALGGVYGDTITTLVDIRNTHGRGNYLPRLTEKETLVYEREKVAVVALSNRLDAGFDFRTVQTSFSPGTRLVELTGNATDPTVDPTNQVFDYVVVKNDGTIDIRVPRNRTGSTEHGKGYVIYGLATPQGTLSIENKAFTIAGETATPATNATARLSAIDVVTADSFTLALDTQNVFIGGILDADAGGDNALFNFNDGNRSRDLNGNGAIDFRTPGSVVYGFEQFTTKRSPLTTPGGDGQYRQLIDSNQLDEGFNYVTVRAFRKRTDGGEAVWTDFRRVIYLDRERPESELDSINDLGGNSRQVRVRSTDGTADSVHVFLDLPQNFTESQILNLVSGNNKAGQIDRDLFAFGFNNVSSGNHVVTTVTYEISGNYKVQRTPGVFIQTGRGAGVGDTDFNGSFTAGDVTNFENVLFARGVLFNPAGDANADGLIDTRDLFALAAVYESLNATAAATEARNAIVRRGNLNGRNGTTAADIDELFAEIGVESDLWLFDLNVDGTVNLLDVNVLVHDIFQTNFGDADLDRDVGFNDLLAVARNYDTAGGWADGDFTGDAFVNFADLLVLAQNFGPATITADGFAEPFAADVTLAFSLVPEPATLGVLAFGAVLIGRRNRRRDSYERRV